MRVWVIVVATVAVATVAVLVWRPWSSDDAPPAEVAAAASPEPAPVAPPSPPDPVTGAVAPPPTADSPQAAQPRAQMLGRVPDSAVVPVLPTVDNREQLLALRKGFTGLVPALARMHAEFARAGRPVPPAAKHLVEMKRDGASNAEQVEYVRTAFSEQADREILLRWLANSPPARPGAPARGDGG